MITSFYYRVSFLLISIKKYYYYYCIHKNHLDRNVVCSFMFVTTNYSFAVNILIFLCSWASCKVVNLHYNNISSLSVFVFNLDSRIVLNFSHLLLVHTFMKRWGLLLPHSVLKVFDLQWLVRWGRFSHSFSNKMTSLLLSLLSVAILI